eukprot:8657173-Pyramimonas_sp.AAC.1
MAAAHGGGGLGGSPRPRAALFGWCSGVHGPNREVPGLPGPPGGAPRSARWHMGRARRGRRPVPEA